MDEIQSENESIHDKTPIEKVNYRRILDSDSSDDENDRNQENKSLEKSELNLSHMENSYNSNESNVEDDDEKELKKPVKDRRKGVPKKLDSKILKGKLQRKSAKVAMEGIKNELNGETSANQTDDEVKKERKEIHIPYHKPKQYSLKEFLSRKTINKPSTASIHEQKTKVTNPVLRLKMNAEELEKFAQKMKERELEALEFFKSESESDGEEDNSSKPTQLLETPTEPIEEKAEESNAIECTSPVNFETNIENKIEKCIENDTKQSPVKISLKTLNDLNEKDKIIDLTTGTIQNKKLTGPEALFQRYLKSIHKPKDKESVALNILSVDNGVLENQRIEVKLDKKIETDHNRPGFSHELFKEKLRNQIVSKRLEEVKKKCEKTKIDEAEDVNPTKCIDDGDECEELEKNIDNIETKSNCEVEEEDEEEKQENAFRKTYDDVDENDEENEDSSDESDDYEEEEEEEDNEKDTTAPKKGRILRAFVDSDEEEKQVVENSENIYENPLVNSPMNVPMNSDEFIQSQGSQFSFNEPSISEEFATNNLNQLFDKTSQVNSQVDEDDLMALCSGQFSLAKSSFVPDTDPDLAEFKNLLDDTQEENHVDSLNTQTVEHKVELKEDNDQKEIKHTKKILDSTDDERETKEEEVIKKKKKKLRKKKIKKLDSSSEEESDDDAIENEEEETLNSDDNNQEDNADILIDYDSEENEIEVKVSKTERIKIASNYFEKEAELSESEWGSADEDEKGLDQYDADLADEEQFDQDQLREEIGRIHARKVMDEDIKNVKKIQEFLFEDEENDGIGRERKFRWKNQGEGFIMEDENARDTLNAENEEGDEEAEIMWRRMRHEREVLIEQSQKSQSEALLCSDDILLLDQNSQTVTSTSTSLLVKRKFHIVKTTATTGSSVLEEKKESPFLIKSSKKFVNNSFLSRDEQTLSKIASFMSNKNLDDEVTNLSAQGGNSMSFAPIEKSNDENGLKRKSCDNDNQKSTKKRKVENKSFLLLNKLK